MYDTRMTKPYNDPVVTHEPPPSPSPSRGRRVAG
jgi:hypothetical protein